MGSKSAFLFIILCLSQVAVSQHRGERKESSCTEGSSQRIPVAGYHVVLSHPIDSSWPEGCSVVLKKGTFAQVLEDDAFSVTVNSISGNDINGDGTPDLIVETYSGGAHCCWMYHILSLGKAPEYLLRFENQRAAIFRKNSDFWFLQTMEGGYDYLRTSHASSFFPEVYLRLRGREILDTWCSFKGEYDRDIAEARSALQQLDPGNKAAIMNVDQVSDEIKLQIMTIVASYLYSGRAVKAWKTLDSYWPIGDRSKLKRELKAIKAKGILKLATKSDCNSSFNSASSPISH